MIQSNQGRWYARLHARGYRLVDPPSRLLGDSIACLARDSSVLDAAIRDTLSSVLLSIQEAPCDIAREHKDYPPPDYSLCHEEQASCARTAILAFVAGLSANTDVPKWVRRDTHPAALLRQLSNVLRDPDQDPGIALARDLMGPYWNGLMPAIRRINQDTDDDAAPDPRAYAAVFDALATCEAKVPAAHSAFGLWTRLTRAVAQGGLAGLYWPYMFVALERARVRAWPPSDRGISGALECVADDVAKPICRFAGLQGERPTETNRRRIHEARKNVLTDRLWDEWALHGWSWSSEDQKLLREFGVLVDGVL